MPGNVACHAAAVPRTLVVGIVAAVFLFGTSADAKPSLAERARAQHVQSGKPVLTLLRLSAKKSVWRTRAQINAFQAAHPILGLPKLAPRPGIPMGLAAYRALKQRLAQAPRGRKDTRFGSAPPPDNPNHLLLQEAGPSQTDAGNGTYPPDTSIAIGGSQIVAAVNSTYTVYDRQGALLLSQNLSSRFNTTDQVVQPRVLYDPIWKRWITTAISATSSASPTLWIGVSKTTSATGPVCNYQRQFLSPGDVLDYDILGMTQDALILTANWFTGNTYNGPIILGMPKAKLYNCLAWSVVVQTPGPTYGTVTPPIVLDDNPSAYFVSADGSNLDLFIGTGLDSFAHSQVTLQGQIPYAFTISPDARQDNSTDVLDTLDGRFTGPSTQTSDVNSGHAVLWNVHTENNAGFPAPKFFEIDTDTNSIVQSGNFSEAQRRMTSIHRSQRMIWATCS